MATIVVFPMSDDYLNAYTDSGMTFLSLTPAELFTAIRTGLRSVSDKGVIASIRHPRHAPGRFNVRHRKPKLQRGGLVLFQYRINRFARVVAFSRVEAVHGPDAHSLTDSKGWIELRANTIRCYDPMGDAPTACDIRALFPAFKLSRMQYLSAKPGCPTIDQWEEWFTQRGFTQ